MSNKLRYKRLNPSGRLFSMIGLGICMGSTAPNMVVGITVGIVFIAIGWAIQIYT